jgi:L,D-peptidoglycan transpeptidase YkuD (ErfK/YbiS/YcfS/YnhG family)
VKKFLTALSFLWGGLLLSEKSRSASGGPHPVNDSLKSEQVIIVVTDDWNSIRATLYCVEKIKGRWLIQFSFPAVVGSKGMADDKTEGDMKSPSGIFHLGPAFGYADKTKARWIHLPYVRGSDTLICVDDGASRFYNHLIDSNSLPADWHSHEDMHQKDDAYKWGLFVQYNAHPVVKGKGSCIFLHIWENERTGTAGCTAMEEKNLIRLLRWIQAEKVPLLVQYPKSVYKKIGSEYHLPLL